MTIIVKGLSHFRYFDEEGFETVDDALDWIYGEQTIEDEEGVNLSTEHGIWQDGKQIMTVEEVDKYVAERWRNEWAGRTS